MQFDMKDLEYCIVPLLHDQGVALKDAIEKVPAPSNRIHDYINKPTVRRLGLLIKVLEVAYEVEVVLKLKPKKLKRKELSRRKLLLKEDERYGSKSRRPFLNEGE